MPDNHIDFHETGYFSRLICDYLDQKDSLKSFYNRFPSLDNFQIQLEEKGNSFSSAHRKILKSALENQYEGIALSMLTKENLEALANSNTFTVTTGHQLNLFTGPLYFLYKIVATINLSRQLKKAYPNNHFVPVYWMATEDHDFDEISFFNLNGKKFQWNRSTDGAVGDLSTEGLEDVFEYFSKEIGGGMYADKLRQLFENAYLKHQNLTKATRYLANELFGTFGLVIVDGHDANLKRMFIPQMKNELLLQRAAREIQDTANALDQLGYKVQVNPREINLFYLDEELRERIIEKEGRYYINETTKSFSEEEIVEELNEYPERFSPNVTMRPLYQEVILPNLCYIGGGGELAYWLELKSYFKVENITFPILLLRNSALIITHKQQEKLSKLGITHKHLFLNQNTFINRKVREISNIDIDFTPQKKHLESQFKALYELAEKTDKSFLGAVKAQEVKQIKGLKKLEKRLLKAQKRKLVDQVNRITELQNILFPNQSLQERNVNFSQLYVAYGPDLIKTLLNELDPLHLKFDIIVMSS
ncbi:bacillithiol biosynthesis cysteine-adding enzyme BshC [Ascidiimonas sp. W6]|uniref:bacillithiol biosynthesis cysteine-adding enzyme BshC n=1 Tax=Ascidiimonas meishanensis TaxID=3128903 RepID=UPI0030EE3A2B